MRVVTSKYRNVRISLDGFMFDSKLEAKRYSELKTMERAGILTDLEVHKKIPLVIDGVKVCTYIADFRYFDRQKSAWIVEDVKSKPTRTALYSLKKKLVKAITGIEIQEVFA